MRLFIAALLVFAVSVTSAEARHHRHYKTIHSHFNGPVCANLVDDRYPCSNRQAPAIERRYSSNEGIVSHPSGCPRSAFCGCGASVRIFGHPVRNLYLARNWFQFPHASPSSGMVAVRNHHVFVIESVNSDGTVVAYDANSGHHQTRIHTISLNGYSVRNPHAGRYASG